MNIIKVPISKVKLWDKNPRNIKTADFERLKKQIADLGVYKPLIACPENGGYTILGGNMRLRALQDMGLKEVDISIIEPKNEAEKVKYALSDNDRVGIYMEDELAELVYPFKDEIDLSDYKIDLGEPASLEDVISDYGPDAEDEDEVPEIDDSPAITKRGDLFTLGKHRLLCGDATDEGDVKRLMGGEKADMVFTDPPYGIDYQDLKHKFIPIQNDKENPEALVSNAITPFEDVSLYICCNWQSMGNIGRAIEVAGRDIKACIVWDKGVRIQNLDKFYKRHEFILYSGEFGGQKTVDGDVWLIPRETRDDHPTAKPTALCAKAIRYSSQEDGVVTDPFLGSGTTLIACEKLNRICYGMEIEPKYCDVIIKRYADYTDISEENIRETVQHG